MYAGLAVYDTMQYIKSDVQTICVGVAMSMGALLLGGGRGGQADGASELEDPHPPGLGRLEGPAADIEIHAKEIIDVRRRLDEIVAQHTDQDIDKVAKDTERDYFMTAEEAKEYHLVDRVIEQH